MSTTFGAVAELKEALGVLQRNVNGHNEFDGAAVGTIRVRLPLLIEELEALRREVAKPAKSYVLVVRHPEAANWITTEGEVKVFDLDLGAGFNITAPREEEAESAFMMAAAYAEDAAALLEGPVKAAIGDVVAQIVEGFWIYAEALATLDEQDKAALAPYLPQDMAVVLK